ncbi:membrane protein [Vibrio galatheae]|uniref:Membrane protein n=1 Tax=Vibrio galatheae TaxID=579748 RepID=A0A0F4NP17_9VIBR|nr:membrane protein [Vibrio galatheae]
MFILYRLIKLAIICVVFFTLYDLIAFGEIAWLGRLITSLGL